MKPAPFDYLAPRTVAETVAALSQHGDDAKVLAGGQSLVPMLNLRLARPAVLVDINGVAELDHLRAAEGLVHIGALQRQAGVERWAVTHLPLMSEALRAVAHNCVFTTHTPVPAGNESFEVGLVERYLEPWIQEVGCDPEEAVALGLENGSFNLTVLAIRLSSSTNGVSRLHAQVSSDMWRHLWPGAPAAPVVAVTNGVHTESWVGPEMRSLYARHLHPEWEDHLLEPELWQRVAEIPDTDLWAAHRSQKERLIRFVRERVRSQSARHGRSPDELRELENLFDPRALTIGFARRFATYKRAHLVLQDLPRVHALLESEERPVQMLFAGKAHPADRAGQEVIRQLFQLTQGDFAGTAGVLLVE